MPARRRPVSEFESAPDNTGVQQAVLDSLIGGYNGYTSPDLLSPQFWAKSSNVYAGQFATIRRARWAPTFNSSATGFLAHGQRIVSQFSFLDLLNNVTWIVFDNNDPATLDGPTWLVQNPLTAYSRTGGPAVQANLLINTWEAVMNSFPFFPLAPNLFFGPYSRVLLNSLLLQCNGLFRGKLIIDSSTVGSGGSRNWPVLEYWGIDAPDISATITLNSGSTATISTAVRALNVVTITTTAPHGLATGQYVGISGVTDTSFNTATGTAVQITVTGGSTFTFSQVGPPSSSGSGTVTLGLTKTVGRSYQYAWENAFSAHVSAPSPASQFVKYTSQTGTLDLVESGTISFPTGSPATVTGVGTSFSPAWIGKILWAETTAGGSGQVFIITAVASSISMTVVTSSPSVQSASGSRFQVFDPQTTHVRLYATGDGGSVYFKIARNQVFPGSGTSISLAGLRFTDTANSEPPNAPFTNEISQVFNLPPPIGQFVDQYQGRPIVYGVAASPQTFFYGNMESTVVGQPPESFGPLNTVSLPVGDGQLFGSANLPTGFILWSNRQDMFKLTGLLTDNVVANQFQLGATIQRLPYKIGCASPYATAVSPLGAMWLSSDREVWLFTDHYAPKNVGKPVQDVLNRINGSRLAFAKMSYYKRGDRSWLALAVALDSSTFNNKLLLLDLDLLASNGQPSFFTFDLATNQPTWYQFDINCEGICTSYDGNSVNHLLVGDVDLITDVDWQPGYYTISAEQNVPNPAVRLHAIGNDNPQMIKTFEWMRVLTNQFPKYLAAQGWRWNIYRYDDDKFVIGLADSVENTVKLVPGIDSNSRVLGLEYSPALFRMGGVRPCKGRRFQIETIFPSTPGLFELRGFETQIFNTVGR